MEYIIDDKGNKLNFVINKKYTVYFLDSVFLIYFLREKFIKNEISALANAEEKGIQIGIEQGIKREKIETVLRLKSLGLNTEQIAKGTCITEGEVEKIIKDNIN